MEKLVCNKCDKSYNVSEFRIYGYSKKNGNPLYDKRCKDCLKKKSKFYRKNNPEKIKNYNDWWQKNKSEDYYKENKEKRRIYNTNYRKENLERIKAKEKVYYKENKENRLEKNKKWREKNKDLIENYREEYYKKNKDSILKKKKEYYDSKRTQILDSKKRHYKENTESYKLKFKNYNKNNRDKINKRMNVYINERKKKDPMFKLRLNLRDLISQAFKRKGYQKTSKTHQILGADFDLVKMHIEKQFRKGMSWDNREEWDIDHIIPVASAQNIEELIALNHYTNLQPLSREENLMKGDNYLEKDKIDYLTWYFNNVGIDSNQKT